jgi:hypothetical protein
MERYGQIDLEKVRFILEQMGREDIPFSEELPYLKQETIVRGPNLEERTQEYQKTTVLGAIVAAIIATRLPLRNISFSYFVAILFGSRLADIFSTITCLKMPWMYETNPLFDAHRLNMNIVLRHLFQLAVTLGPLYLIGIWFSVPVRILLLTYSFMGFAAAVSNLYQMFTMTKANTLLHILSNTGAGTCVFFLLKTLF